MVSPHPTDPASAKTATNPFGFVVVDKPAGLASRRVTTAVHGAVAKAIGRSRRKVKVGHVGTLDPLATGVLAIAIGPATRLSDLLHEGEKRYEATFRLGLASPTDDVNGPCESVPIPALTEETLRDAIGRQIGRIAQRPPAYSAKKIDGQRAYEIVRRGGTVDLPPASVTIHAIEVTNWTPPDLSLSIACGPGTYVRAIGRDVAAACGTAAVMTTLRRTRSGPFRIADAAAFEDVLADPLSSLVSAAAVVSELLPTATVAHDDAASIRDGRRVPLSSAESECEAGRVALLSGGDLVAIAEVEGQVLQPRLVFK